MITAATVAQAKALWVELTPIFQADLTRVQLAMEKVDEWGACRALQARATALRAFLKLPQDLEQQLALIEQSKREGANHGMVELGPTERQ